MISWEKALDIRIRYLKPKDRKNKQTDLAIEYVQHDDRINNPMKILIPDIQGSITVDAEYMKKACEKILNMQKI